MTYSQEGTNTGLKTIPELHSLLMGMDQCVVLDIETTGFSPGKHSEILEIGAIRIDFEAKKGIGHPFRQYIRPAETFTIPARITELTGITWAMVADQPYIEEVLPRFAQFIGDLPVVAHNAAFDWPRFLVPAFKSVGLHATNECICSMRLAKYVHPNRGRSGYNLESLCSLYGHQIAGHHDALNDAAVTGSVFIRLLEEYRQKAQSDGSSLLVGSTPCRFPSAIPIVDFNRLAIKRVSYYAGCSKRHGPKIYVTTNFGRLAFSVRRRLWTCVDLWIESNAPVQTWGAWVLYKLGLDTEAFIAKYTTAEESQCPA